MLFPVGNEFSTIPFNNSKLNNEIWISGVPWSIKVEAKNKQNRQQRNVLNPIYQVFQQLVPDDI
jgi:hypothetical protein